MNTKFLLRLKLKNILILLSLPILLVYIFNYSVELRTNHKIFTDVSKIKHNDVGLVLGTSKHLGNGDINLYFKYRIEATLKLFEAGKIDYVLVSGDNGRKHYDEPTDFKIALMEGGIPEDKIFLDFAGFRTLDSVVRAKKVFGLNRVTFISQEFHNQRAIFLANHFDIDALGYNAQDVYGKNGTKVKIREYLARTKLFIDLIFGVSPKFLGPKVEIK